MRRFTDQGERLRRIVRNALEGCAYAASREEEDGRHLVLEATRPDGRRVAVRFRAVNRSEATATPQTGATLRLRGVDAPLGGCLGAGFGLLRLVRRIPAGYARVRIDAGEARLDITCQDAEWWEEDVSHGPTGGGVG